MRRVIVLGCSGAGKSTLAARLGARLGLPMYHLDSLFWQPGWVEPDKAEWAARIDALAAGDAWVMDGNFARVLPQRLARADTAIVVSAPRWLCLMRVLRRAISSYGRVRPDMAPGCPERIDLSFLLYIWRFEWATWPQIARLLASSSVPVHAIKSRKDADRFLEHWAPAAGERSEP